MNAVAEQRWFAVGSINDIPRRGARQIETPWMTIALVRTVDDRVYAIEDRCPHRDGPLSQGIVHGNAITCPLHNWVFDLNTGQANGEEGRVATFPVQVEGGRILIDGAELTARSAA